MKSIVYLVTTLLYTCNLSHAMDQKPSEGNESQHEKTEEEKRIKLSQSGFAYAQEIYSLYPEGQGGRFYEIVTQSKSFILDYLLKSIEIMKEIYNINDENEQESVEKNKNDIFLDFGKIKNIGRRSPGENSEVNKEDTYKEFSEERKYEIISNFVREQIYNYMEAPVYQTNISSSNNNIEPFLYISYDDLINLQFPSNTRYTHSESNAQNEEVTKSGRIFSKLKRSLTNSPSAEKQLNDIQYQIISEYIFKEIQTSIIILDGAYNEMKNDTSLTFKAYQGKIETLSQIYVRLIGLMNLLKDPVNAPNRYNLLKKHTKELNVMLINMLQRLSTIIEVIAPDNEKKKKGEHTQIDMNKLNFFISGKLSGNPKKIAENVVSAFKEYKTQEDSEINNTRFKTIARKVINDKHSPLQNTDGHSPLNSEGNQSNSGSNSGYNSDESLTKSTS